MVDNTSRAVTLYRKNSSLLVCGVLSADKALLTSMRCFSRMLIPNVHKSIIVMNSIDTRFSRNVFEAVQKTCTTCFIGSKTTRLRLVVLNPIKHSCSFFKHYLTSFLFFLAVAGFACCLAVNFPWKMCWCCGMPFSLMAPCWIWSIISTSVC